MGEVSDSGEVASLEILRRIQWFAVGIAIVGALLLFLRWGPEAAVSLTLGAAISIVSLRSLEVAVRRLRVEVDGSPGPGGTLRFRLRWWVLMTVLGFTLIFGALSGTLELLALLVGLSAVPLAALAEAGIQVCRSGVRGQSVERSGSVEEDEVEAR
ncbi:MAG: ATP synthase subunit I [Thermoanaerobaculia bacterium]|nr:ATP synthase subunit I [Thermoanaerobaculia bacterium]